MITRKETKHSAEIFCDTAWDTTTENIRLVHNSGINIKETRGGKQSGIYYTIVKKNSMTLLSKPYQNRNS
jgi:hypothetical protein